MAQQTTDPVRLPPGPRLPKAAQAGAFLLNRRRGLRAVADRYGHAVTLNLPIFGQTVALSDPALIKEVFTAGPDLVGRAGNLGQIFGPGSTFSLDGEQHKQRRKLLIPAFHGTRMRGYEGLIEEEVLRETAHWPDGAEFPTMPSMMRITVKAILRAVFGAEGALLDELADKLPKAVESAAQQAVLPPFLRVDLGPWSPWGRVQRLRRRYDEIIAELIAIALADPDFEQREDILSLLLRARYPDGSAITHEHIADELLTLLAAGHETTATTLAWAFERIRRRPDLLSRLSEEAAAGRGELRQAVIWEVQRNRPVVDLTIRVARVPIQLGPWVLPAGTHLIVAIGLTHEDPANFDEPDGFTPDRFLGGHPDTNLWIPFGGGVRRCPGAAFANMEMDTTLRTVLTRFDIEPTESPAEKIHSRGIATAPADGGRVVVRRRAVVAPDVVAAAQNGGS
ncbi:cytochrome P450 [Mycolicibacterium brumae]|uniref:Cytochrome P450 n=1 Tax=Mycolicibacterium brumae TaxID=85968 RepID=A0A2G5P3R0_9MYCO|nr:cytochrome P450 [Mycolicibacterium brumae]MCV7192643.1 cytochrome P450 [Mycolicibacterium brumae]PIB73079.1 cytochrome P450 [Mycolicibacterium brumae]RWA16952.1 hypothetical protein MBRU_19005 [Mycolicibacterium brumae DSM 44177]UWW07414.1 cytochrome P450 [Mycolicibacterium brumae]